MSVWRFWSDGSDEAEIVEKELKRRKISFATITFDGEPYMEAPLFTVRGLNNIRRILLP